MKKTKGRKKFHNEEIELNGRTGINLMSCTLHGDNNRMICFNSTVYGKGNHGVGARSTFHGDNFDTAGYRFTLFGDHGAHIGDRVKATCNSSKINSNHGIVNGNCNEIWGDYVTASGNSVTMHGKGCSLNGEPYMIEIDVPDLKEVANDTEKITEQGACIVCLTNEKRCVVQPCCHLISCAACARGLVLGPNHATKPFPRRVQCPMCRGKITSIHCIY